MIAAFSVKKGSNDMLELQNVQSKKAKLAACDISQFKGHGSHFRQFLHQIQIEAFRHILDLKIDFDHPVTVISGTNKVGKTSILLLIACSHEQFIKIDSTSPAGSIREHNWNDVLSFTSHDNVQTDYIYGLKWRVGNQEPHQGTGKRLASSQAWSGIGKRSLDVNRINAKIRNREVRLIDLERILPGRSFSNALYRKANASATNRLDADLEKAFSYIFLNEDPSLKIYEAGSHINKSCFLIEKSGVAYSSYNAASGEEAVIYLLKDIIDSPKESLILIDEIEAGFHPSVQRRIADIIQYISWRDKKQFIITTHSPTLLSSFPPASRKFVESSVTGYRVIPRISQQAARSKMDSVGHPLLRLYCEDDLADFLISKIVVMLTAKYPQFNKLINIIRSGPVDQVENDYLRHKRNLSQYRNKVGCCAVFDGDYKSDPKYSNYYNNPSEHTFFLYPYEAPEKFLVRAYLNKAPNQELAAALVHSNHHSLFQAMENFGLAVNKEDALEKCYAAFEGSPEFSKHEHDLSNFLVSVATHYSEAQE